MQLQKLSMFSKVNQICTDLHLAYHKNNRTGFGNQQNLHAVSMAMKQCTPHAPCLF